MNDAAANERFAREFLAPLLKAGDMHALSASTAQALQAALGGEYGDLLHSLMARQVQAQHVRIERTVEEFTPPMGEPLDMVRLNKVPEMIRLASDTALRRDVVPALQTAGLTEPQAKECIAKLVDMLALEAGMRTGAVLVEHLEDSPLKHFGERILMPVMGEDPRYVQRLMERMPGVKLDADMLVLSDAAHEALENALSKHPRLVEELERSVSAQMEFVKGMIVPEVRRDTAKGGIRALGFRESMKPIIDKTIFVALHDALSPPLHAAGMPSEHQSELYAKLGAVLQIAAAESILHSRSDPDVSAVLRAERTQQRAQEYLAVAIASLAGEQEGKAR